MNGKLRLIMYEYKSTNFIKINVGFGVIIQMIEFPNKSKTIQGLDRMKSIDFTPLRAFQHKLFTSKNVKTFLLEDSSK